VWKRLCREFTLCALILALIWARIFVWNMLTRYQQSTHARARRHPPRAPDALPRAASSRYEHITH
jgi:hypothetical protein